MQCVSIMTDLAKIIPVAHNENASPSQGTVYLNNLTNFAKAMLSLLLLLNALHYSILFYRNENCIQVEYVRLIG